MAQSRIWLLEVTGGYWRLLEVTVVCVGCCARVRVECKKVGLHVREGPNIWNEIGSDGGWGSRGGGGEVGCRESWCGWERVVNGSCRKQEGEFIPGEISINSFLFPWCQRFASDIDNDARCHGFAPVQKLWERLRAERCTWVAKDGKIGGCHLSWEV